MGADNASSRMSEASFQQRVLHPQSSDVQIEISHHLQRPSAGAEDNHHRKPGSESRRNRAYPGRRCSGTNIRITSFLPSSTAEQNIVTATGSIFTCNVTGIIN
ncbi:hypothetical protein CPLU01_12994 [Colletotrichum plurivorum]|uniref:Uncharacterized protein n=1 Tax=Colletotrichum plurivorum TaxID=2175906 RepID=A0A8H6N4W2_9PEZI|nr:hypothetical protein CPLU01_12994 [Colletotrichum plurivorum]